MKLPNITIDNDSLLRFDDSLEKEWLVSNGLGGYSSSTVLGLNTRKYHGLLVAALNPPGNRTVCIASLDESLITSDFVYDFGTHEFHDSITPGHLRLKEFSLSPFPTFTYQTSNFILKKTVFMPYKSNSVVTLYSLTNSSSNDAKLQVFPLMTCRHIDTITDRSKSPLIFNQESTEKSVVLNFNIPKASVSAYASFGKFFEKPEWVSDIHYREENLRGEADTDDCYRPGYFEFLSKSNNETRFAIAAAATLTDDKSPDELSSSFMKNPPTGDFEDLFEQEIDGCSQVLDAFYETNLNISSNAWLNWILLAANSFVVQDFEKRKSVIAGYFWFESWGRDTFISLPGLMLVTGRFEDAKYVLDNFIRYCRKGLIPNIILDRSGQPLYNTVDGTLWYVNAVFQYLKYTRDFEFVKDRLWETLKSIVENYEVGTEFNIRLDKDGLISHGVRLTWMDAYADQKAVTPREGKAVEIQALWYNSLRIMQLLANHFEDHNLAEKYSSMAEKTRTSFTEKFWNTSKECLFDVLEENGPDLSLRPNQIIAVSLDFTMLNQERNRKIVDFVQGEFLTPCGLRTLSRSDPRYKAIYNGIMRVRDQAYHNGAVWPWLLGPFITGYLKAWGNAAEKMEFVMKNFVQALFEKQIYAAGLGTISEIFDGDSPHKPRGCISQAWSVAEPLRAYVEDVLQIRPKYEKDVFSLN